MTNRTPHIIDNFPSLMFAFWPGSECINALVLRRRPVRVDVSRRR
jgi:hypothetical protein